MFDKVRIGSLLDRIENSILLIQSKSGEINCPDDFLLSQDGMFILSGICMQLVFIGESVKTIDEEEIFADENKDLISLLKIIQQMKMDLETIN